MAGHHPTNKLIGREPIPRRNTKNSESIPTSPCGPTGPPRISRPFKRLSRRGGQVTHVILTRSPLNPPPKTRTGPFDLHVLSTPPAFVLSQDQTLQTKPNPNPNPGQPPTRNQPEPGPSRTAGETNPNPTRHPPNQRKEAPSGNKNTRKPPREHNKKHREHETGNQAHPTPAQNTGAGPPDPPPETASQE